MNTGKIISVITGVALSVSICSAATPVLAADSQTEAGSCVIMSIDSMYENRAGVSDEEVVSESSGASASENDTDTENYQEEEDDFAEEAFGAANNVTIPEAFDYQYTNLTPAVKSAAVSVTATLNGQEKTFDIITKYTDTVTYTGKVIKPADYLNVSTDLSEISSALDGWITSDEYSVGDFLSVTYTGKNNKNASETKPYFVVKIKLSQKNIKKAGVTNQQLKELKKAVALANKELAKKANRVPFRIDRVNVSDLESGVINYTYPKYSAKVLKFNKQNKATNIKNAVINININGELKTITIPKSNIIVYKEWTYNGSSEPSKNYYLAVFTGNYAGAVPF